MELTKEVMKTAILSDIKENLGRKVIRITPKWSIDISTFETITIDGGAPISYRDWQPDRIVGATQVELVGLGDQWQSTWDVSGEKPKCINAYWKVGSKQVTPNIRRRVGNSLGIGKLTNEFHQLFLTTLLEIQNSVD